MPARSDVVVFVGSSWAALQHQNTRWRSVLQAWASDDRIERLRVVDYPSLSVRNVMRPLAEPIGSWDARVDAFAGRVALWRRPTPLDARSWRATAAALDRALPPTGGRRVAVAATPLWAPVLAHLTADRVGFDAVDDWRALPTVARVAGHVVGGYRAARSVDAATAVSALLADRLRADFGIDAAAVPNGVDVDAFARAAAPPPGLPAVPFAVYLGVVQERVDLELVAAAASVLPVVIAGPADAARADDIARAGATWIGPVEPDAIPGLLRAAAVGLLPHRVDALTTSMHPMKVLEYLAAGLPVVATPVPIGVSTDRVLVAEDVSAFRDATAAARDLGTLDGPDPAVAGHSWRAVADALVAIHIDAA
jgi:teichuronic acid biosynthesis glycosyltransferase TuaH